MTVGLELLNFLFEWLINRIITSCSSEVTHHWGNLRIRMWSIYGLNKLSPTGTIPGALEANWLTGTRIGILLSKVVEFSGSTETTRWAADWHLPIIFQKQCKCYSDITSLNSLLSIIWSMSSHENLGHWWSKNWLSPPPFYHSEKCPSSPNRNKMLYFYN